MITKQWTVRSLLLRHPHLARKLAEKGVSPGHSYLSLEAVAVRLGCTPESLVDELAAEAAAR